MCDSVGFIRPYLIYTEVLICRSLDWL